MKMNKKNAGVECVKPLVLIILDGFGYRENPTDNAIKGANTPNLDQWWKDCPHTLVCGSGISVGLPGNQMGNSEVGHVNLGAGRVVYQDLTRIDKAIQEGSFADNAVLSKAVDVARDTDHAVHILGLLSAGGVHSHELQIQEMAKAAIAKGAKKVFVHAFLDGRDTAPRSAEPCLQALDQILQTAGVGKIASIVGRYYAMDRDNRWDRVQLAYDMLAHGKSEFTADSAEAGLAASYARDESDEFVKPTLIGDPVTIQDGDSVIFMNFRADRVREISHAFVDQSFDSFDRGSRLNLACFATLTEYEAGLDAEVAYPPEPLVNVLGDVIAQQGLKQLRIAETEKYAHVTFFFNGGVEQPFDGEDRILVPSPNVATYDLQPEMSAFELTDKLVDAISSDQYDFIICNYANADMVGHTGNYDAAVKAVEALDQCLLKVVTALKAHGGEALITADHGNAEQMSNEETGQAHTAHTSEPVPLIYVGRDAKVAVDDGVLSDIAPTMLALKGVDIPAEMTGRAVFEI